jgi:hyperosmotically inducible periplasmic protein
MKFIKIFLISAILAIPAVTVPGQSNQGNISSPTIEVLAIKQILKLPHYGVFDIISIKVEDGLVTLSGKVVQPTTKSSAGRAVEKIKGVTDVINNIEVLPLSGFDNSIRSRTLRTLSRQGGLNRYFLGAHPAVRIIVARGHLSLKGFVANRGDFNLMNVLANGVSGVFSVTNNLIIENENVL